MKIAAVCGSGLGSSFMVEMNIKSILDKMGVEGIDVTHFDLGSATPGAADVFFVASDLGESMAHLDNVVVLDSIIDMEELERKVKKALENNDCKP